MALQCLPCREGWVLGVRGKYKNTQAVGQNLPSLGNGGQSSEWFRTEAVGSELQIVDLRHSPSPTIPFKSNQIICVHKEHVYLCNFISQKPVFFYWNKYLKNREWTRHTDKHRAHAKLGSLLYQKIISECQSLLSQSVFPSIKCGSQTRLLCIKYSPYLPKTQQVRTIEKEC